MKKSKNSIYSKPCKLMPFLGQIAAMEANIAKYEDKLFHLQNKMDYTLGVSKNIANSPQFQTLVDKKARLEEKKAVEIRYIYNAINAMIANFRNTKIEDLQDVKDIYRCIDFAVSKVQSEEDKGAIMSNILALHVSPDVENNLYNGIEKIVELDKELLTGYLIHNDDAQDKNLTFFVPSTGIEKLFENSLKNRDSNRNNCAISRVVLEDRGYLEKFIDRVDNKDKIARMSGLSRRERAFIKKQVHKYKIERKAKPKVGSSMLKCCAAVPSAIGKVLYGTTAAVGHIFGFVKKTFNGIGFVLASPFVLASKGLKKLSVAANKNKTYDLDAADIYKNLKRSLKKNRVKVKNISKVVVDVEQFNDGCMLNLHGTVNKKGNTQEEFEALYLIKEGEYKNMKAVLRDNLTDEDLEQLDFVIGEYKDNPEIIRLMRRIAEITNEEEALCVNFGDIRAERVENTEEVKQIPYSTEERPEISGLLGK